MPIRNCCLPRDRALVDSFPVRPPLCRPSCAVLAFRPWDHAEKADRFKPLTVEADLPGKIDLLNQFVVFSGSVVGTKGTLTIRAARIEVREMPDGYHTAIAYGTPQQHATFRQKRDVPDEFIAGDAERLEYDGKSDVVRFVGNASVRRLRGGEVSDEISGNLVTYDSTTEVFNVSGGAPRRRRTRRRVRATLTPKEEAPLRRKRHVQPGPARLRHPGRAGARAPA